MKNIILFVFAFVGISLFTSCEKDAANTFYFDAIGCDNPWDNYYTADTFSYEHLRFAINGFLTDENIDVNSIEIDFDSTKMELCYACHCKTGTVIIVNVESGKKWKMKNLGFYK
jgi:hypothetical protein